MDFFFSYKVNESEVDNYRNWQIIIEKEELVKVPIILHVNTTMETCIM
jgi:hypothetical protein